MKYEMRTEKPTLNCITFRKQMVVHPMVKGQAQTVEKKEKYERGYYNG